MFPAHESCYVDVDNAEHAYITFFEHLQLVDPASIGIAAVVCGPSGCGKTSLIHRCGWAMEQKLGINSCAVIDLSDEDLIAEPSAAQCCLVAQAIIDALHSRPNFISSHRQSTLPTVESGADLPALKAAMRSVSTSLKQSKKHIVTLVPRLDPVSAFQSFLAVFRRPYMSLLIESDAPDLFEDAAQRMTAGHAPPPLALKVGPLSPDDGWKYVSARQDSVSGGPQFLQDAVDAYMADRAMGLPLSIRELERACIDLFEQAAADDIPKIELTHFQGLYLRFAILGKATRT